MATLLNIKVEQLLALFVTRALGLTIEAAICDVKFASTFAQREEMSGNAALAACAAWRCDRGAVKICGRYDAAQSQRINAHVLYIEWWIGTSTHHASWWRSSVKHPGEWTGGYGRSPPAAAAGAEFEPSSASLDAMVA